MIFDSKIFKLKDLQHQLFVDIVEEVLYRKGYISNENKRQKFIGCDVGIEIRKIIMCALPKTKKNSNLHVVDYQCVSYSNQAGIASIFTQLYQSLFTSTKPSLVDNCLTSNIPR